MPICEQSTKIGTEVSLPINTYFKEFHTRKTRYCKRIFNLNTKRRFFNSRLIFKYKSIRLMYTYSYQSVTK